MSILSAIGAVLGVGVGIPVSNYKKKQQVEDTYSRYVARYGTDYIPTSCDVATYSEGKFNAQNYLSDIKKDSSYIYKIVEEKEVIPYLLVVPDALNCYVEAKGLYNAACHRFCSRYLSNKELDFKKFNDTYHDKAIEYYKEHFPDEWNEKQRKIKEAEDEERKVFLKRKISLWCLIAIFLISMSFIIAAFYIDSYLLSDEALVLCLISACTSFIATLVIWSRS